MQIPFKSTLEFNYSKKNINWEIKLKVRYLVDDLGNRLGENIMEYMEKSGKNVKFETFQVFFVVIVF